MSKPLAMLLFKRNPALYCYKESEILGDYRLMQFEADRRFTGQIRDQANLTFSSVRR